MPPAVGMPLLNGSPPNFLGSDLNCTPTTAESKCDIVNKCWGIQATATDFTPNSRFDPYLKFYSKQCRLAFHNGGAYILAKTHGKVLEVARLVREDNLRENIEQDLKRQLEGSEPPNLDERICGLVDLAARLVVMVGIGDLRTGFVALDKVNWTNGTLKDSVSGHFGRYKTSSTEQVKLEPVFNARNLERIAGIEIEWTANLADHLRLIESGHDTKVAIFHHATFLKALKESSLFPSDLVNETLNTIALLFPQSDIDLVRWYKRIQTAEGLTQELDQEAVRSGTLLPKNRRIEKFDFWRERLINLKQVFDESEPKGLKQWWYDRRKKVQWYTFWVAIVVLLLTVFFGFVQSIEGAIQVYKACHPS